MTCCNETIAKKFTTKLDSTSYKITTWQLWTKIPVNHDWMLKKNVESFKSCIDRKIYQIEGPIFKIWIGSIQKDWLSVKKDTEMIKLVSSKIFKGLLNAQLVTPLNEWPAFKDEP